MGDGGRQYIDPNSGKDVFAFGPFRFIPAARRLDLNGVPVKAGARSLDILHLLVERAGKIVTKEELLARAWPGLTVEDTTFRVEMTRLKRTLGAGKNENQYVKTLPGQGYSFAGAVRRAESTEGLQQDSSHRQTQVSPDFRTKTTNLPKELRSIVGREEELTEIQRTLAQGMLITLTGLGGIGKTRLAIELGRNALDRFAGRVWLIDLTTVSSDAEILSGVAGVLGMALVNPANAIEKLAMTLAAHPALLIFDKCEHLTRRVADTVERLMARLPSLSVIATSEEPLHIPAEQVYKLNPLSLPPAGATASAEFGATALFTHLCDAGDKFLHNSADSHCVTEICRRLDGIPLALELAAAAVPKLGLRGLLASLTQPAHPPGAENAIDNIRMRQVMAWSHGLLDSVERLVFRRLARFSGGFSLEAASAVVGPAPSASWEAIDAIGDLIERSLVMVEHADRPRYRMLDVVRSFALEKLIESGEIEEIDERHARYYSAWLEAAVQSWETEPESAWRARHEPEADNIREALDWALAEPARASIAVAMAGAASRILYYGQLHDARRYVERALQLINPDTSLADAGRLLTRAGALWAATDRERALSYYRRAADLYRESQDTELAVALSGIGVVCLAMARHAEAQSAFLEARDILTATGTKKKALLGVHSGLGNLARNKNDYRNARKHYEDAMAVAQLINDANYEGAICQYRAELEFRTRNINQAIELGREAVSCMRRAKWPMFLAAALSNLTSYLLAARRISDARLCGEEALAMAEDIGGYSLLLSLMQWALIGAIDGDVVAAAKLYGFLEARFASQNDKMGATETYVQEQLQATLQAALPTADILEYKTEGNAWVEAEAIVFARQHIIGVGPSGAR